MAKKEENLPTLAALVRSGNTSYAIYNAAVSDKGGLTKHEQQITTETQKQAHVMRNQRLKTDIAMDEMSQLHKHAADEYQSVVSHLAEVNAEAQGKSYQPIVEEFNKYNAELAATHLLGAMKVGAHTIAEQIGRAIDLPLVEEKPVAKPGFLQRLLGD